MSFADVPQSKWNESVADLHLQMYQVNRGGNSATIAEAARDYQGFQKDMLHRANQTGHATTDLDEVARFMSAKSPEFKKGYDAILNNLRFGDVPQVTEHLFDGMDLSQFPDLMNHCAIEQALTQCASDNCGELVSLVGTQQVGCNESRMRSDLMLDDLDFGVCEPPDAPLTFAGINSPIYSRMGPRCRKRIGFSLKSNTRCNGIMASVMNVINTQVKPKYDKWLGKATVAMILGNGTCGSNCGSFDYSPYIDDCRYKMYYGVGECGPWNNLMFNDQDLSPCSGEGLLCAIERMARRATDPWTGDLIRCCDNYDMIAFGDACSTKVLRKLLGAHTAEYNKSCCGDDADSDCVKTPSFPEAARPGWGTIRNSECLTRSAFEYYKGQFGCILSDAEIMQMIDRTYIIGCIRQAIVRTVEQEWTRREYGGTNTWAYFNQGVEQMVSFEATGGFFVNPMRIGGVIKIQGLPDCIGGEPLDEGCAAANWKKLLDERNKCLENCNVPSSCDAPVEEKKSIFSK